MIAQNGYPTIPYPEWTKLEGTARQIALYDAIDEQLRKRVTGCINHSFAGKTGETVCAFWSWPVTGGNRHGVGLEVHADTPSPKRFSPRFRTRLYAARTLANESSPGGRVWCVEGSIIINYEWSDLSIADALDTCGRINGVGPLKAIAEKPLSPEQRIKFIRQAVRGGAIAPSRAMALMENGESHTVVDFYDDASRAILAGQPTAQLKNLSTLSNILIQGLPS